MANILHLSKYYYPFMGGLEEVVRSMAEGSVQKGHHVRVFCSGHGDKSNSYETINGVEVIRSKRYGVIASQPICPGYLLELKELISSSEVIYLHTPNPLAEISVLIWRPVNSSLYIVHHSDIIKQKILKIFYRPLQKLVYQMANRIIVATSNHIKFSTLCSSYSSKCSVIPFGLKSPSTLPAIRYEGFGLFVGRLVEYKGLFVLIEAMKTVSGQLIIVGDGPLLESLSQRINKLGLQDKIKLTGRLSDNEVQELYATCRFLVLPSISSAENFGLVQIEAMMFSKPVLSTRLKSGASTVVIEGETGFIVDPGDSKSLSKKMNQLFESEKLCKELGEHGMKRFKEEYSYQVMIDRHDQVLREDVEL